MKMAQVGFGPARYVGGNDEVSTYISVHGAVWAVFIGLCDYYRHIVIFGLAHSLGIISVNRIIAVLLNRLMTWLVSADLWERAQSWVKLYEDKELPATEKRARVLVMLETEIKTLGLGFGTSLLNFAIEAAVQYVRRKSK